MLRRVIISIFFGSFLLPGICWAEEGSLREFQLPKRGVLQLAVPRSWKDQVRQPPHELPPTISLSPSHGNGFQVLITPLWAIHAGVVMPEREEIRRIIAKAAEGAKSQAVEKNIPVQEIQSESVGGYCFSATDRSPKPGEFKYMTQGMLRVGELAATFTILYNDGAETVVPDALRMLKGARHVYAKSP